MSNHCPKCSSSAYKRNGFTRHGKQNYRCLDCGRQFSLEPEAKFVVEVTPTEPTKLYSGEHRKEEN